MTKIVQSVTLTVSTTIDFATSGEISVVHLNHSSESVAVPGTITSTYRHSNLESLFAAYREWEAKIVELRKFR